MFYEYLTEAGKHITPSITKGHTRTLKSGKIVHIDPFLTLKKVSREGHVEINFEQGKPPIKLHSIMSALLDPAVSLKFKRLIMHHLEVSFSDKVKYAKLESKDGKLYLIVNPKYIHKIKDTKKK